MYRCLDCGATFEEPRTSSSRHWEIDTRQDETVYICPACSSEDIEKLKLCPCERSYIVSGKDWCQDCLYEVSLVGKHRALDHEQTKNLLEYWISEN